MITDSFDIATETYINEEDFLSHLEALNQKQISGFIVKKFGGGVKLSNRFV